MAAVRVLASEHIKFTILTTAPVNPAAPTAAELNAGIDASCLVFFDDFVWTSADSDTVGERALCESTAAESFTQANYDLKLTAWRQFDSTTGAPHATADALFQAMKVRGTELYGYVRRTGKKFSDAWASGDEIQLGGKFMVDTPQALSNDGLIKYRVPCKAQAMEDFIAVAA